MPRKGWRKPPGYAGYQRSATRSRRAGSPSAGPHLLLGGDATADIDEAASTPAIAEATQETEHANVDTAEADTRPDDGLISSRLRQRDLHEMVQSAGDEGVNTIDGSNSPPPESDDDSSDDDEVAYQPHPKKRVW